LVKKILHNKLILILIHIAFGFLGTLPFFPKIYGLLSLMIPLFIIFSSKNKNEEAFIFAAYLAGAEVFTRMIDGSIVYEAGKYGVILFLLLGVFVGGIKQKLSVSYFFYLLLLLLGIVFTQVPEGESIRKAVAFNLSGPFVLGISALYFYKRRITNKQLLNALFFMLLPLFSMVTYLYLRTPALEEIVFGGSANLKTSGGFGPNQVATVIGVGIFIIAVLILLKYKITGFILFDSLILVYFLYRGLLTFSRGGIFTGVIALLFFFLFFILTKNNSVQLYFKYITIGGVLATAIWFYTSLATGGMLDNRYTGKNASGIQKEDITSGRAAIFEVQIKSLIYAPFGIGVGSGKYKRIIEDNDVTAASHNEIGRLIEEHGIIGLLCLLFLLTAPLVQLFISTNYQRAFIVAFYLLWFLTISHSAMRIAFPGFIYGLSLIKITENE
jgi:hypothetical protein